MDPLTTALMASIWGAPVAGVIGFVSFPWRRDFPQRWWTFIVALPPLACLLWGNIFAVEPGHGGVVAPWKGEILGVFLAISVLLGLIVTFGVARRFKLSGSMLSLAALGATILFSFGALMAITGDFI